MRVVGIVLLTVAAVLIIPPLGYGGYVMGGDRDPYWLYVRLCALVAGLGLCVAAAGGMLLAAAGQREKGG